MPVNNFDDYPMAWKPEKDKLKFPVYKAIAQQLEADILSGKLCENTKLPPQRELADFLDLNLSTITKAYKLCEEKGLLYAVVGKGTFTAPHLKIPKSVIAQEASFEINLGQTTPLNMNELVCETAKNILKSSLAGDLFTYAYPLGTPLQRDSARIWLKQYGLHAQTENVIITAGTQSAIAIAMVSQFSAGDKIATDKYTYPNFSGLASMLGVQLVPVQNDEKGMLPQELERLCKQQKIKGVYLMPGCANPINYSMPSVRREELAAVIEKQNLLLIEDDSCNLFPDKAVKPIAAYTPAHVIYINGLSKILSTGLRVSFLAAPPQLRAGVERGLYNINFKTPTFNVEIATQIMNSEKYAGILKEKQADILMRNAVYEKVMKGVCTGVNPRSLYQWTALPKGCTGSAFEETLARQGVQVYGSERFLAAGEETGEYVRISTSSPQNATALEKGLLLVKEQLSLAQQAK